ncbi:MAG: tRNA adenosine(34) deaminase TadA [Deltaproteobacteria bacterium]|nr:tRNA adenosine(34) deaminase TadA [Deltaproteobacteria bacterium]
MFEDHTDFMNLALNEAEKAKLQNEVPVGAVLVDEKGGVIAKAHNMVIALSDPTAHAEILALRKASTRLVNYRLLNTTLYVTIEPCIMCMGALIHARVKRVVYGARDPKWGAAGSLYCFTDDKRLNHHPEITGDVCAKACSSLIRDFFREKRKLRSKSCLI